jgi:signal transduction histidine kinase
VPRRKDDHFAAGCSSHRVAHETIWSGRGRIAGLGPRGVGTSLLQSRGPAFAAKHIDLHADLQPARVEGDAARLDQVAANLLSNALQYTLEDGSVNVAVRAEDGWAVFEVSDTGIGIAAEDLAHVFTRFWRGEKSRSRNTGGAGIGLAIVRELVRAHDGSVLVESTPDKGSRFLVRLPPYEATGHRGRIDI